ncbi:MAG TPA: thiamine ABC transporter substrate-binding protein [Candidatus Cloacimonadota bacterium]|nr:thiamine ABC transporter substrate-binding protein [Candidatus Cloacimonadota bacterium]
MKNRLIFLLILLLILMGCKKESESSPKDAARPYAGELNIYALESFRSSGLETALLKDFRKQMNCQVNTVLFENTFELSKALRDSAGSVDIVLGIDSGFAVSDTLAEYFAAQPDINLEDIYRDSIHDYSYRLLPYAQSHLSLVYNSRILPQPPKSFGELQDARHFHQVAVCDPHTNGLGRATLYWSVALFGSEGFEHMLKAIRKNVYKIYPDQKTALEALYKGECRMMLGLNTTSVWLMETDPDKKDIKTSMFQEGSYLYTECVGQHKAAANPFLAQQFIAYLLSPPAQKMVIYKTGMLPVNRKTLLPNTYSTMSLSTWSVNSRLSPSQIKDNTPAWLENWMRLMSF